MVAWADEHGWASRRDEAGNLVVAVPPTPGREHAPTVILQGHLDIVCERDPGSPYDPRAGRIHVVRDGDWLRAEGTTLGADDGVAIAAMLAIAEDPAAPHGPLELLMTVEEEIGLAGASRLDPDLISGAMLLNLDSEEDGMLTVGCAGGADARVRVRAPREPVDGPLARVTVSGGLGGHSGGDIALGRANAIKVLARALHAAPELRIASLDGGASRNAIPRDATAVVSAGEEARAAIVAESARIADAYRTTDADVHVTVADADSGGMGAAGATAWSAADSARILDLIATLPTGPLGMSVDFPGVVETSTSLGLAQTQGDELMLHTLTRSANDALIADVTGAIAAAARLAGAVLRARAHLPGMAAGSLLSAARRRHGGACPRARRRARGDAHPRRSRGRDHRRQAPRHRRGLVRPRDPGPARARRATADLLRGALHAPARRPARRPLIRSVT